MPRNINAENAEFYPMKKTTLFLILLAFLFAAQAQASGANDFTVWAAPTVTATPHLPTTVSR